LPQLSVKEQVSEALTIPVENMTGLLAPGSTGINRGICACILLCIELTPDVWTDIS